MKTLFLDCFSGVSGNMLLGALLGLGYPESDLRNVVKALGFDPDILKVNAKVVSGLASKLVTVTLPENEPHRHLHDIDKIIDDSALENCVKEKAKAVFLRLAKAEAKVHGTTVDHIHFHEVGAVDAMVDIVGTCAAVCALDIDRIVCSPLPLGHGTIQCAHGILPVPVPATVALLEGVPTYSAGREGEHVTPTGAALVSTLADDWAKWVSMKIDKSAYGAGTRTFEGGPPNLLRAVLGRQQAQQSGRNELVIETNIDDMNPEFYGPLTQSLFKAGALDVTLIPCYMKKGRPGTLISIIGGHETLDQIAEVLFSESTTIGIRTYPVQRIVCERFTETVKTKFGDVRIKISRHNGRIVGYKPEFEDCKTLAGEHGVSVQQVYTDALAAFSRTQ